MIILTCENSKCKNRFERKPSGISPHNYCSRSCAVTVNNTKFPKNPGVRKKCAVCEKEFVSLKKYCSTKCQAIGQTIPKEKLIKLIQDFYFKNGRIPLKKEFPHYRSIRGNFGTWNNAIIAAGFEPNPVMFAKKYAAKDGHKCDSLAEMIIDDWLYARDVLHIRSYPYPGNLGLTVDFLVEDYWIEFFGLVGQHKRYDELKELKFSIAKEYKLKLIEIYPEDLFPESKLEELLKSLSSFNLKIL